jgi:hypothetical protein
MDLDSVADALYALAPEEFTAVRDDIAKKCPDPKLAKAIKSLRKPTVAAHVVNVLVREHPDVIDALLDIGDALRLAMSGDKGDVRRLSEQRRDLVSSLVSAELTANVRDDVTATLEAATADPELGQAVRSGRLVKPLRYAGFGAMPDLGEALATAIPRTPPAQKAAPKKLAPAQESPAKKAAAKPSKATPPDNREHDLTEMRQRVFELSGAADDAQRRYDEASRAVTEARKLLEGAEAERTEAHKAAREAHAEAEKARRELGRLERS